MSRDYGDYSNPYTAITLSPQASVASSTASDDDTSVGNPADTTYTDLAEHPDKWNGFVNTAASLATPLTKITTKGLPAIPSTPVVQAAKSAIQLPATFANPFVEEVKSAIQLPKNFIGQSIKLGEEAVKTGSATAGAAGSAGNAAATGMSAAAQGAAGMGIGLAGQLSGKLISGKQQTGVGNAISSIGGAAGGIVSMIPGIGWVVGPAITAASGILGGLVNAGWGHKTFGVDKAKNWLNQQSGFKVNGSNDNIDALSSQLSVSPKVTYDDGWFTNKGEEEANRWNQQLKATEDFNNRSIASAAANNIKNQMKNSLRSYSAYGGPIGGAIDYGFMSDYLTMKGQQAQKNNKVTSMPNSFMGGNTLFAAGGPMDGTLQAHGSNWGNVSHINNGGTHEQNPQEGVQFGTDNEGVPNMVEEGEVVWNDFVFSDRIKVPQQVKKHFGIRGKKELSFADAAKKLQKENEERPNDPISEAGLDRMLESLANAQEELKRETEAKKAQEEFAKLSPEEQKAIIEEYAMAQEQAQQQSMQELQAQQQAQQAMTPEEQQALAQQQAMQQEEQMSPEEQQDMA